MINRRAALFLAAGYLALCSTAFAAADGSQLELPDGAEVAIVVFEDLQCPDCARAHPELLKVSAAAGVPLVVRDFPITRHVWAFPAAILARHFGTRSPALESEFRSFIFENQPDIRPENLRRFGEQFAGAHGLELPTEIDPDGKLQARVQADYDFGRQIKLEYVPLIFVLGRGPETTRWVEVTDVAQLATAVERMRGPAPR